MTKQSDPNLFTVLYLVHNQIKNTWDMTPFDKLQVKYLQGEISHI